MHINSLFSLLLINILFGSIDEPKKKNIIKKQLNSNQAFGYGKQTAQYIDRFKAKSPYLFLR